MKLSIFKFRVSTISWGNIFDVNVLHSSRTAALAIVEDSYKGWRVEYFGQRVVQEGSFV